MEFVRDGSTVALPVPVQEVASTGIGAHDVLAVSQQLDGAVETRVNGVVTHRFVDSTTNARATIYGIATSGDQSRFDDFTITLPTR